MTSAAVDPQKVLDLYPPLAGLPAERLRALLQPHLPVLARPVGFGHRRCRGAERDQAFQQWMGPD